MRAFVEVRKVLLRENDLKEQMKQIKERLGEHRCAIKSNLRSPDSYREKTSWMKKRLSGNGMRETGSALEKMVMVIKYRSPKFETRIVQKLS